MAKSDALIFGSFALQFFERSLWQPSDVDIYVKNGEGSEALGTYLAESEGYVLETTRENDEEYEGVEYIVSVSHPWQ